MYIYGFSVLNVPEADGLIKIGQTEQKAEDRVRQQIGSLGPIIEYKIDFVVPVPDGVSDKIIHKHLKNQKVEKFGGEWFRCSPVKALEEILNFLCHEEPYFLESYKEDQKKYNWKNSEFYKAYEVYNTIKNNPDFTIDEFVNILNTFKEVPTARLHEINSFVKSGLDVSTANEVNSFLDSVPPETLQYISNISPYKDKMKTFLSKYPEWYKEVRELSIDLKNLYHILKEFDKNEISDLQSLLDLINSFEKDGKNPLYEYLGVSEWINPEKDIVDNLKFLVSYKRGQKAANRVLKELKSLDSSLSISENFKNLTDKLWEWNYIKEQKKYILMKEFIIKNFGEPADGSEGDLCISFGKYRGYHLSQVKTEDYSYYEWLKESSLATLKSVVFLDSTF